MIAATGLRPRDDSPPDGDIEFSVTGLRPGEKLHEELLAQPRLLPTPHPRSCVPKRSAHPSSPSPRHSGACGQPHHARRSRAAPSAVCGGGAWMPRPPTGRGLKATPHRPMHVLPPCGIDAPPNLHPHSRVAGRRYRAPIGRTMVKASHPVIDTRLRLWRRSLEANLGLISAGVAFFGFLAIFPAAAAVIAVWGFASDPGVIRGQIQVLQDFLPARRLPPARQPDPGFDLGQQRCVRGNHHRLDALCGVVRPCRGGCLIQGLDSAYGTHSRGGMLHALQAVLLTRYAHLRGAGLGGGCSRGTHRFRACAEPSAGRQLAGAHERTGGSRRSSFWESRWPISSVRITRPDHAPASFRG